MKIAVTGSSGFVGRALVPALRADGHEVVRLVRRSPSAPDEARWDPRAGKVDRARLAGLDAAVNLAGAGVGDKRWTEGYKRTLYESHVGSARTLATALAGLDPRPAVLVGQGAIGIYGEDRGDTVLTEHASYGDDLLARIVRDKEAALEPAEQAGIRVVKVRAGLVMDRSGSTLGRRLLPLFKMGFGGKLGSGDQWWSLVALTDVVRALQRFLTDDTANGAYNVTAPEPTTNAEFTQLLGEALHRPTLAPAPAFAIKLVLGDFAGAVLGSQRAVPERLVAEGFAFVAPDARAIVVEALR
jgi:uncharacterized protein (TIGR01777 family)